MSDKKSQARIARATIEARRELEAILADPNSSPSLCSLARARLATNSVVGKDVPLQSFSKSLDSLLEDVPNMPSFMVAVKRKWVTGVITYELINQNAPPANNNITLQQTIITNAAQCLLVADELCSMIIMQGKIMPYLAAAAKAVITAHQSASVDGGVSTVASGIAALAYYIRARILLQKYLQGQ